MKWKKLAKLTIQFKLTCKISKKLFNLVTQGLNLHSFFLDAVFTHLLRCLKGFAIIAQSKKKSFYAFNFFHNFVCKFFLPFFKVCVSQATQRKVLPLNKFYTKKKMVWNQIRKLNVTFIRGGTWICSISSLGGNVIISSNHYRLLLVGLLELPNR